jgi:hypothetical protein
MRITLTPDQERARIDAQRVVSSERAREIARLKYWQHFDCLRIGSERPDVDDVTADENDAITKLWGALPGWSSWMSALSLLK